MSWLQILDKLTATQESFLAFEKVVELASLCGVPQDEVPLLLRFFHGILMWHEEDELRDVIILDSISYFVTPATIVICKHAPSAEDSTYHSLEIHKACKRKMKSDFLRMVDKGALLRELLINYADQANIITHLMLKYGPLMSESAQSPSYLVPALLPTGIVSSVQAVFENFGGDWTASPVFNSFYFVFSVSTELEQHTTLNDCDLKCHGFLPSGLFEPTNLRRSSQH